MATYTLVSLTDAEGPLTCREFFCCCCTTIDSRCTVADFVMPKDMQITKWPDPVAEKQLKEAQERFEKIVGEYDVLRKDVHVSRLGNEVANNIVSSEHTS